MFFSDIICVYVSTNVTLFQPSDPDCVDRLIQCVREALHFFSVSTQGFIGFSKSISSNLEHHSLDIAMFVNLKK